MQNAAVSGVFVVAFWGGLLPAGAVAADAPSPKLALSFKPVQKNVEYDTPEPADVDKCVVRVERRGKASGWAVYNPTGQILRRFVDTNGDNIVDQWRYFHMGLEVYRDIDSNANNKVDQCRWFNTGGTRWGTDSNEDGRIDSWKIISAEETAEEAVQALIRRDEQALQALLVTRDDVRALKLKPEYAEKVLKSVENPAAQMRSIVSNSKILTPKAVWRRFDGSAPGIIPAEDEKADGDLWVYENAMGIVETDGQPGLVQIGELVRIGDAWKLTQLPQPLEGESLQVTVGGILMQPPAGVVPAAGEGMVLDGAASPEMVKLIEQLQKLDAAAPGPDAGVRPLGEYNAKRADILAKLFELSRTDEEREQWGRQLIDGIATAVQMGTYPEGLERLRRIEGEIESANARSELIPYAAYRRMLSQYSQDLQQAEADPEDRQKVLDGWLKQLEEFVQKWPDAEDTPDALLQLAITQEFAGKVDDARSWYERLVNRHSDTVSGEKAAGAVRRLDLEGRKLALSGAALGSGGQIDLSRLQGRVVLVLFWSTWCKPCTEDLPQLKALYQQHRRDGFEIVGVNLDNEPEPVRPYLAQHQVPWPQIYEPGGLDSAPAKSFGIISLPTMFLVDRTGTVVSRSTSVPDLKEKLPELLEKK